MNLSAMAAFGRKRSLLPTIENAVLTIVADGSI
jgi:hypothetical protein